MITKNYPPQAVRPGWLPILLALGLTSLKLKAAATESNLEKTFAAKPGGQLVVDADFGSITITAGDREDVSIEVKRKVTSGSSAKAQEIFAAHEVTFSQDGDRVEVHAKLKDEFRRLFNRGSQNLQVEFRIAVPSRYDLDLRTSAGSITSTDIEGKVKAKTAGGSLKFGRIKGPFDGTTSAGSITLSGATGPVTAKTSGGSIHLGQLDADTTAETSAGSITVESAKAKLKAKSHGGGLELGDLAGPAEVETSGGSIRVKSAQASLSASTAGGSITIDDARDTVVAHTSAGSITARISAQPQGNCRLTTAGGGIQLRLAEGLAFDVDAHTSAGRVTTDLPIVTTVVGEHVNDKLQGKLNGGGKDLVLKTSAGSIQIKKL